MYIFDKLDLVEQRGLGVQTITELTGKFDLPLPLVTYEEPYMIMTFPRSIGAIKKLDHREGIQQLSEEELKGYNYIKLKKNITRKEYEEHFGFSKKKAERHMKHFVELALVKRKGSGPNSYYEIITTLQM